MKSCDIHYINSDVTSAYSQVQNAHTKLAVLTHLSNQIALSLLNVVYNFIARLQSSQYRYDHLATKSYVGNLLDIDLYC